MKSTDKTEVNQFMHITGISTPQKTKQAVVTSKEVLLRQTFTSLVGRPCLRMSRRQFETNALFI